MGVFFDLCPVAPPDIVYDLGSGDGRLVFAALERGAGRAVGIELQGELVKSAGGEAETRHMEGRVTFLETDILKEGLSEATVVFCYLSTGSLGAQAQTRIRTESRDEGCRRGVRHSQVETFP